MKNHIISETNAKYNKISTTKMKIKMKSKTIIKTEIKNIETTKDQILDGSLVTYIFSNYFIFYFYVLILATFLIHLELI
jgi:hypothetical protein